MTQERAEFNSLSVGMDRVVWRKMYNTLILDTDIDTDCDDAGALAVLHALADRGEVEIAGVVCDVGNPWAAACAAAVNRACLELDRPFVHAAVYQAAGQIAVFDPRRGPCFECLWPGVGAAPEQSCSEAGVLGPAAGAIACMQAVEVMKLILGLDGLKGRFAMLDLARWSMVTADIPKAADCPACGPHAARERAFIAAAEPPGLSPAELKAALASPRPPRLVDLRYEWERGLCRIPGDEWADFNAVMLDGGGLPRAADIVLYCKRSSKSAAACRRLAELGYAGVKVLRGGIDAWAAEIDPGMTRY